MNEIEEFITRRFKTDCNWMNGNCYYFAKILVDRFCYLTLVYVPCPGHFMAYDSKSELLYDYTGKHTVDEVHYVFFDFNQLKFDEPDMYFRIVEGCIL